ncbi:DUF2931 family protein [Lacinutrix salivirga]
MSIHIKLIITVIIISLISCNNLNKEKYTQNIAMEKYEWRPTANAPKYYPAEIISGNFYLEDNSSIYIPKGHTLMSGWGKTGATHVVGEDFKALPNSFDIKWVSYLEEKFYGGSFTLPIVEIKELFKEGYKDILGNQNTFSNIVLGLAPGGVIVIWLHGDKTVEIGRFKAKEIKISKEEYIPNAILTVEEFVKRKKERRINEDIKGAIDPDNIPFGKWDSYRTKYNWNPAFEHKNKGILTKIYINYFNGENLYTLANDKSLKNYSLKAIPKDITMYWEDQNNDLFGGKILFEDNELQKAFNTLSESPEQTELQLLFQIDKYNGNMEIVLKNNTESIKLNKAITKIFETTK